MSNRKKNLEQFVIDSFRGLLNRDVDDEGLFFYTDKLLKGSLKKYQLLTTLLSSAEFKNLNRDALGNLDVFGNIYAKDNPPKILFLHFERTSGSLLVTMLGKNFYKPWEIKYPYGPIKDHHRFFLGHDPIFSERMPKKTADRICITILRNPVDRIISLYKHSWHNMNGSFLFGTKTLNEWLAFDHSDIMLSIDNIYVRRLVNTSNYPNPLYSYSEEIVAGLLDQAIKNLQKFDCVGIFEDRRSISEYLTRLFKSPIVFDVIINASKYDISNEEISTASQLKLQEYTYLDSKIYDYFNAKAKASTSNLSA